MSKSYFMGLDFGTQGVRCGVTDEQGNILNYSEKKYQTTYPKPGWAEQSPADWVEKMEQSIGECYDKLGAEIFSGIKAMAVCTTSSTVIPMSDKDEYLSDAILWMDNRSVEQARRINASGHALLKHCGKEVSVEWIVPKMMWLKENRPDVYEKAVRIVEQQDYINHHFTGRWCASVSQATCKSNFVEEAGGYDKSFFEAIGFPDFFEKADTDVLRQAQPVGTIKDEIADKYHLSRGIIVYQGGVDAHVNMIGLGVVNPGETGVVMGSSFVHLSLTDQEIFKDGIWGPYKDAIIPDMYCMEGGQVSAGSITKWFLNEFGVGGENPYGTMAEEAAKIPAGSEGVVALDFFQGNRTPYKDPVAKGIFYGITLSHTRAHLYRAILESVAYGTRNIVESMESEENKINRLRGCGGVVFNPLWLQIIADVTGKPIVLTEQSGNAGVLGCAVIAAVGSGEYESFPQACEHMVHVTKVVEPDAQAHEAYTGNYRKYLDLYECTKHLNEI